MKGEKKVKWIKNNKGEIIGCEIKEQITLRELKENFLDEWSKQWNQGIINWAEKKKKEVYIKDWESSATIIFYEDLIKLLKD